MPPIKRRPPEKAADNKKAIKNILFLSTGALMSPTSLLQGESIYGIAPLIKISHNENYQEYRV